MNYKQYLSFYLLLMQMACTSVVWNGGIYDADRAIDTNVVTTQLSGDKIHAFGRISQRSNQPLSGSILMMGEQYWYAIRPDISETIIPTLTTILPKRYAITAPYTGMKQDALTVTVVMNTNHFSSDFCLDYMAENTEERHILRRLKFQPQANPNHYRQCYAVAGSLYAKPKNFAEDYHFHQHIPVQLILQKNTTDIQANKLARNLLLTPLALAVDTVSGMVMLPVLLIGDLF